MIYDLNGRRFSLTSALIEVQGLTLLGGSELKITETLDPGEGVEGTSPVPLGFPTGKWNGELGFKLPLAEALATQRGLGGSFGTRIITGSFTFTEVEGDGVETILINGARVKSTELDGGDRQKASMVTFSGILTQPSTWGGVKLYDPDTGFFDPSQLGFSLSF